MSFKSYKEDKKKVDALKDNYDMAKREFDREHWMVVMTKNVLSTIFGVAVSVGGPLLAMKYADKALNKFAPKDEETVETEETEETEEEERDAE